MAEQLDVRNVVAITHDKQFALDSAGKYWPILTSAFLGLIISTYGDELKRVDNIPPSRTEWPQDQPRTKQQVEENTTFKIYANELREVLSQWVCENLTVEVQPQQLDALMYMIALRSKVR